MSKPPLPLNTWVTAQEAVTAKVKHLSGHQRLGPGFTRCGKTVGRTAQKNLALRECELCAAKIVDEDFSRREADLASRNYEAMRRAKIGAEEALLQKETEIIHLKEENMALGQAQDRQRQEMAAIRERQAKLDEAIQRPIRYWLKQKLGVA